MAWGAGKKDLLGDMRAEKAARDKQEAAEKKFEAKHGVKPLEYISKAVKAVSFPSTSKASGYTGRSRDGAWHSDHITPSTSPSPDVVAYHELEDEGKRCAQRGDVVGAITHYDKAVVARQEFARKRGLAADGGHDDAIILLRQRRASLTNLKVNLQDTDPGVVAARQQVMDFYQTEGVVSPY